jgi:hypothetical protein
VPAVSAATAKLPMTNKLTIKTATRLLFITPPLGLKRINSLKLNIMM